MNTLITIKELENALKSLNKDKHVIHSYRFYENISSNYKNIQVYAATRLCKHQNQSYKDTNQLNTRNLKNNYRNNPVENPIVIKKYVTSDISLDDDNDLFDMMFNDIPTKKVLKSVINFIY